MRVSVTGAGVLGLSAALMLAKRGCVVDVHERSSEIGPESCSWLAGGMLAPWCEAESADDVVRDLGAFGMDFWEENVTSFRRNGTLVVAAPRDLPDLTQFAERTSGFRWVDGDEIAALEPDLAGRFQKGLFFEKEGHMDPRGALMDLKKRLDDLGVTFHLNSDGRKKAKGADWQLDCRGLAARDELVDLRGVKGEMLVLKTTDIRLSRPVRFLHPRVPVYIVPRDDGRFMVGATMIENDEPGRFTVRSMLELLGAAYALHPSFGEAEIEETGVGTRPAFADNLPRIRVRGRRVFANGLYRHGYLLSPAVAEKAAAFMFGDAVNQEFMDEVSD